MLLCTLAILAQQPVLRGDFRIEHSLRIFHPPFSVRLLIQQVEKRVQQCTLILSSGIDNPLNNTAFTFGGGIRWRDDDLKYLLGSVPIK